MSDPVADLVQEVLERRGTPRPRARSIADEVSRALGIERVGWLYRTGEPDEWWVTDEEPGGVIRRTYPNVVANRVGAYTIRGLGPVPESEGADEWPSRAMDMAQRSASWGTD